MKELESFLKLLKTETTKNNYSKQIKEYIKFKNIETVDEFSKMQLSDLVDFVDYLRNEKQNCDNSIKTKLEGISAFCVYLIKDGKKMKENYAPYVISKLNSRPNVERRTFLTDEEQQRFLDCCNSKREKAMFHLFLNNGLRIDELINIDIRKYKKFQDKNGNVVGQITFRRKRNKIQTMFVNSEVVKLLDDYIENERKDSPYFNLFISNWGNPMNASNIDKTILKIAEKAGINKRISAHSLRRSLATSLHNKGVDISGIKAVLGHTNISTTQIYVRDEEKNANNILAQYAITN